MRNEFGKVLRHREKDLVFLGVWDSVASPCGVRPRQQADFYFIVIHDHFSSRLIRPPIPSIDRSRLQRIMIGGMESMFSTNLLLSSAPSISRKYSSILHDGIRAANSSHDYLRAFHLEETVSIAKDGNYLQFSCV